MTNCVKKKIMINFFFFGKMKINNFTLQGQKSKLNIKVKTENIYLSFKIGFYFLNIFWLHTDVDFECNYFTPTFLY
jgi:hypothetical protein